MLTVAQLLIANDKNSEIEVNNIYNLANFLKVAPAIQATTGTRHTYTRYTVAPSVGFRDVNVGRAYSNSTRALVNVDLKLLDASFAIDKGLAKAYKDGVNGLVADEAIKHLQQAMYAYEQQIFEGTDAGGFDGLNDLFPTLGTYCISAAGTTAASQTSVYVLNVGEETMCLPVGGELEMGEVWEAAITDPADITKQIAAVGQNILGYAGLCLRTTSCAVRIANVESSLTDDLIAEAISLMPGGATHIVMNRKAKRLLQNSRVATNATGAPAPFPIESMGVPIVTVETVGNTQAVVVAP